MEVGCVVCGSWEFDRHHVKSKGSGGPDEDWNLVNLCREHHGEIHTIGRNRFTMKYQRFKRALELKGWVFDSLLLRWSHVRERSE
jgi:hypothetical protein